MSDHLKREQLVAKLTDSLDDDPFNMAMLFELGYVLKSLGRFKEALGHYETILQDAPDDYETLNAIGDAYFQMKQPLKAIEYHKRAVGLFERDPDMFVDLAEALLSIGDSQSAIAALKTARPLCLPGEEAMDRIDQLYDEIG